MGSVKFTDNKAEREEKAEIRKKILDIMNTFPEWYKTKILTTKIQNLAKKIGNLEMGKSHPIESIDPDTFTLREYQALKALEYTDKEIFEGLGMSKSVFDSYKGVKK